MNEQVVVTDELVTNTGASDDKIQTRALPETGMGTFALFSILAIAISSSMIAMNRRKNS